MKNSEVIHRLYLALGFTQAAHSIEEVLTGLWKNLPAATTLLHTKVSFVPVLQWNAEGFAAANLVVVALMLGLCPFVFQNRRWAFKIVRVAAVIEVLNGLAHIIPAVVKGGYRSGSISAVFLLGIGSFLLFRMGKTYGPQNL